MSHNPKELRDKTLGKWNTRNTREKLSTNEPTSGLS
jgi:hypothetical protein